MTRDVRREIALARCLLVRLEAVERVRVREEYAARSQRPDELLDPAELARASELADGARAELALHWATVGEHL